MHLLHQILNENVRNILCLWSSNEDKCCMDNKTTGQLSVVCFTFNTDDSVHKNVNGSSTIVFLSFKNADIFHVHYNIGFCM